MASVNSATWTWPADVLEFARENGIEPYLEPLREAARQVVPTMTDLRIYPSRDHDDPNDRFLIWEIMFPWADNGAYRERAREWYRECRRVLPADKRLLIVTFLVPERG
jgi:hypothetical protein